MNWTSYQKASQLNLTQEEVILSALHSKSYRSTPLIITFCENILTAIDIQQFMEMGLHIIRFQTTRVTFGDKLKVLAMIKRAVRWICEKYEVTDWPLATCIDIPNSSIKSGYKDMNLEGSDIEIKVDTIVEITSNMSYWDRCTPQRVFIDDTYTIREIKPGQEITFCGGSVVMNCIEVIDEQTVKCKVARGGRLDNAEFVCFRGIPFKRPPFTAKDLELLKFAKDFKFDIVTMNGVRKRSTLKKVRRIFGETYDPLLLSTINDQEGLDNIDEIIQESDGIVLAREILAHQIINKHQMTAIQMQIAAKCRRVGKPFYISGDILENTLNNGLLTGSDLSDITNAVIQGAGFLIRNYKETSYVQQAIKILDSICRTVETLGKEDEFRRLLDEFKIPVNAAEAATLACAALVRQSGAITVIVPTVSGKTATQLAKISPCAIILTVSTKPEVAKKLMINKGIITIIYDKKKQNDWRDELNARIKFAVHYGVKQEILKYGNNYVTLKKSSPTSAYCDHISVWNVQSEEVDKVTAHERRMAEDCSMWDRWKAPYNSKLEDLPPSNSMNETKTAG